MSLNVQFTAPPVEPRRQLTPCPTCGQLIRGLLAPCIYPACQAADIAYEYGPKAKRPEMKR